MTKLEKLIQLRDYLNSLPVRDMGEYEELTEEEQNKIYSKVDYLKS